MGIFDKLKDSIGAAAAGYTQKKAESEQHRREMLDMVSERSNQIVSAITSYENNGSFFKNTDLNTLLSFTKEFYDKILMPANSVGKSRIMMYPYMDTKQAAKFSTTWPAYNAAETPIIYLKAENRQEILVTDQTLYFAVALPEDNKFIAKGSVSCDEISEFSIGKTDTTYEFKCDELSICSFAIEKTTTEDFITLDNYFTCIKNQDFEITDEEVDKLIQKKIGEKIYSEIKKYMVYDDELMVYFAWGLDSLSAKDYIVCTNKQIMRMDRELFGATANVKQFYYEDIVSASTEQNSTASSLTGALIDTAITAATKTCDLVIATAGTQLKINTLYKVEAERIVAIYHHYRKEAKTANSTPQVIVQQQQQADPLEQLEKLSKLKEMGVISEEEFNTKKADLLAKL